jgi:hypothetical protein
MTANAILAGLRFRFTPNGELLEEWPYRCSSTPDVYQSPALSPGTHPASWVNF